MQEHNINVGTYTIYVRQQHISKVWLAIVEVRVEDFVGGFVKKQCYLDGIVRWAGLVSRRVGARPAHARAQQTRVVAGRRGRRRAPYHVRCAAAAVLCPPTAQRQGSHFVRRVVHNNQTVLKTGNKTLPNWSAICNLDLILMPDLHNKVFEHKSNDIDIYHSV